MHHIINGKYCTAGLQFILEMSCGTLMVLNFQFKKINNINPFMEGRGEEPKVPIPGSEVIKKLLENALLMIRHYLFLDIISCTGLIFTGQIFCTFSAKECPSMNAEHVHPL